MQDDLAKLQKKKEEEKVRFCCMLFNLIMINLRLLAVVCNMAVLVLCRH